MEFNLKDQLKETEWYAEKIKNWDPAKTREGVYCDNAEILLNLIRGFKQCLKDLSEFGIDKKIEDYVDIASLKVAGNYEEIVSKYLGYPIWACDFNGFCLVGENLDEVESIDRIEQNIKRGEWTEHLIKKAKGEKINMGGWSAKRAGFESGGSNERSFNKTRRRDSDMLSFTEWRAALIGSLERDKIPYQVLDDETITAEIRGEKWIMSPEQQKENFKQYQEQFYLKI
jgi:hypothetical protein